MAGFSFCGVHCSQHGLEYIPSNEDMIPSVPDFKLKEENVTGRYGGYFYGETIDIQEKDLECYFEMLSDEDMEKILRWVHHGRKGKLVFDDRPFAYYDAIVSARPTGVSYVSNDSHGGAPCRSGTITFKFKYNPFAKMEKLVYSPLDKDNMIIYSGVTKEDEFPPLTHNGVGNFLLYNPGSEYVPVDIVISGGAPDGLTITNHTTGDVCTINSVTNADSKLGVYGSTGKVLYGPSGTEEYGYVYHNDGYISLAPCIPYRRNLKMLYTADSNVVSTIAYTFTEEDIGRYVYLDGEWRRIIYVQNEHQAVLNTFMTENGSEVTMITNMNDIEVTSNGTFSGTLEFTYVPMIR